MRYYTTTTLAMFCASAITACVWILAKFKRAGNEEREKLSKAAEEMFFDLMFSDETSHVKLLLNGLKNKCDCTRHGNGIFIGKTAAFLKLSSPPCEADIAQIIAKSKHYGASKTVIFTKKPISSIPDVLGITVKNVYGEDVYKLFSSLGAIPHKKFLPRTKSRRAAYCGIFDTDKIVRYAILAAAMFLIAAVGKSIITFICAAICAILLFISLVFCATRAIANKHNGTKPKT